MSNMLRTGKRIAARKKKKETKHHTKEFYKILGELDRVAELLKLDDTVTEENFVEKAQEITEVKIAGLEKFVLKGKLGFYESMEKDINKAKESNESEQED